jgi:hypothetical protein
MAEDDKYVPSGGNLKLDPTALFRPRDSYSANHAAVPVMGIGQNVSSVTQNRTAYRETQATEPKKINEIGIQRQKAIEDFNSDQDASRAGLLNKRIIPSGYEFGDGGVLRNIGYQYTKGYLEKERTRMDRAEITERTWGKYRRGETKNLYGMPDGKPSKKSEISASMSPTYGQMKPKNTTLSNAATQVAGGLCPWIGRFNPTACGPILVSTYGFSGGVFQSNAQESINNGFPINSNSHWT